jgi:predicted nucleic acid-binding Zn ribbon protein
MQPLRRLLHEYERAQAPRLGRFLSLQRAWAHLVGAAVAAHTRPVRLSDGVLVVAVSSAVWAQNLCYQRRLLIGRLAEAWGTDDPIRDIRFETTLWYSSPPKKARVAVNPEHPSFAQLPGRPPAAPGDAVTLAARLDRLREIAHWRAAHLPRCPRCRGATPPGELARWGMCGSCALSPR